MIAIDEKTPTYKSETVSVTGRKGPIAVEHRRPVLSEEERRRRLEDIEARLYGIFSRYAEESGP